MKLGKANAMAGAQSEGHENLTGADCKRIAKGVQDYAWEGIHDVLRVSLSLPPPLDQLDHDGQLPQRGRL